MLVESAESLARGAGAIVRRAYGQVSQVETKGVVDLVTETDRAAEAHIVAALRHRFPDHSIWAEESGRDAADADVRWIIDPLDGTTNFAHRLPHFAVLIAVQARRNDRYETLAGVCYDPLRDECFVAEAGGGMRLNGVVTTVSTTTRLIDAALATGFAYDRLHTLDDNHREFCRLNLVSRGVRRFGSAGLDFAYVACGRFDGFWERGLQPWDMAAGMLLVEEAGGRVTAYDGSPARLEEGRVVASNGPLHAPLCAALAAATRYPTNSRQDLADHLPAEIAAKVVTS